MKVTDVSMEIYCYRHSAKERFFFHEQDAPENKRHSSCFVCSPHYHYFCCFFRRSRFFTRLVTHKKANHPVLKADTYALLAPVCSIADLFINSRQKKKCAFTNRPGTRLGYPSYETLGRETSSGSGYRPPLRY